MKVYLLIEHCDECIHVRAVYESYGDALQIRNLVCMGCEVGHWEIETMEVVCARN